MGLRQTATLHDPLQLARFVVSFLPGPNQEFCACDWPLLLILEVVEPRHELETPMWLPVHHLRLVPGIVATIS
jgi:hypothetical protein